jgi:RHH-type proline utilization regulon transcriptional repressor/proline dehydrogenase/delta 1-pyrroline-5-carboxylate dehydrogenase
MTKQELDKRIIARGRALFAVIADERPSLFDTSSWIGKVMAWCFLHEEFKVRMFRFVDVFPSLTTSRRVADHIRAYFGEEGALPLFLAGSARPAASAP